jgi:hypothetical protein
MVTFVVLLTGVVVTVKVALVAPAATVTLAGVVAAALLSERVTSAPPVGAAPVSRTVLVEELPPVTDVGLMVTLLTTGRLTVRVAVLVPL